MLPPGTAQEHAADAAAAALLAGRPFTFGRARPPASGRHLVAQRYMAWEHSMLGDVDPG